MPLIIAVCGLVAALSVSVTAALRYPLAVGANVTEITQVPPGARLVQALVSAKSWGSLPLITILAKVTVVFS